MVVYPFWTHFDPIYGHCQAQFDRNDPRSGRRPARAQQHCLSFRVKALEHGIDDPTQKRYHTEKTTWLASKNALEACTSSVGAADLDRNRQYDRFGRVKSHITPPDSSLMGRHGAHLDDPSAPQTPYSMLVGPTWTTCGRPRRRSTRGTAPESAQWDDVGALYPFPGLHRPYIALV